ncbi:MAG: helix-turn-helix domain-containing protein [Aliarcobacter sp.]|jgi:DNA-binding response OmpR family regulator|nr:helix-turn-helix domain-containing protein [Aliarcobacter sp.]
MIQLKLELSEQLEKKFISKLKREELLDSEYIQKLIENDLESKIDLGEGFIYDMHLDKLFDKKRREIEITKIEKKLLLTLIEYTDKIIPVDILISKSWNKTNVTIYSFRNVIKKIRDKTYYELIKNHSSLGYSINISNT